MTTAHSGSTNPRDSLSVVSGQAAQDATSSGPPASSIAQARTPVEARVAQIAELLKTLDQEARGEPVARLEDQQHRENQLIQVRLGLANGLFAALRWKHSPTASHSFRVAVGCTAWAIRRKLSDDEREWLEVAALLHDVGKIGVPDEVLVKPGKLLPEESAALSRYREVGLEILKNCCATDEVLDIIHYAPAWYDGSVPGFDRQGAELPLGARMVSIIDAFDAMTTDHVYRPARSMERAFAELYEYAGSQFDPALVAEFVSLHQENLMGDVAFLEKHWLGGVANQASHTQWQSPETPISETQNGESQATGTTLHAERFKQHLIDNMHDGVVFIDAQMRIIGWNLGAERLTGISESAIHQKVWTPSLLALRDDEGRSLSEERCPVARTIKSGTQSIQRLTIRGRDRREAPVDLHAIPVYDPQGVVCGVSVLLRDASHETSLEKHCLNLQTIATQDPLTQVANRAEFDRMLDEFVTQHSAANAACSLIICDIDHFKRVNDNFGHQAGDSVIIAFANLLKMSCRSGDFVARYGGEEFVMLCANCNNATAAERAEKIRLEIARIPYADLGNRNVTVSFGVTELQPGDTPETMLRRSDRALLLAKDRGRNMVVQLGAGMDGTGGTESQRSGNTEALDKIIQRQFVTNVPLNVSVEKLRGFVADHSATIVSTTEDEIELKISSMAQEKTRRSSDRAVLFSLTMRFSEQRQAENEQAASKRSGALQTVIDVSVSPHRVRDRRNQQLSEQAHILLTSLQSYLVARHGPIQAEES